MALKTFTTLKSLMIDFSRAHECNHDYPHKIKYTIWRTWKEWVDMDENTSVACGADFTHNGEGPTCYMVMLNEKMGFRMEKFPAQQTTEDWGSFGFFLWNYYNLSNPKLVQKIKYFIEKGGPQTYMTWYDYDNKNTLTGTANTSAIASGSPKTNNATSIFTPYNELSSMINNWSNYGQNTINANTPILTSEDVTILKDEVIEKIKLEKENKTMDKNIFNFDFGPVNGDGIRLSPYGIATRTNTNGDWVAYDVNKNEMVNVNVFNFDVKNFIYKMPVPLGSIAPGDLIIHQKIPMFVRSVNTEAGTVEAINYKDATVANILPVKSPFGFNFITKIVSFIDFSKTNANPDNPFGNMLPMMMLANNDSSSDSMLPLLLMMNGNMDMSNPMMMYFLLKDGNQDNMLPLLFMMQNWGK